MPIIIFGTKSGNIEPDMGGPPTTGQCGQCHKVEVFEPVKQSRYFTLFWIPVIPLGSARLIRCPNCFALYKRK